MGYKGSEVDKKLNQDRLFCKDRLIENLMIDGIQENDVAEASCLSQLRIHFIRYVGSRTVRHLEILSQDI